jgi:hypothetical protein
MIAPLITFLSSSAGGALIGWIQSHLEQKRADKLRSDDRLHQERMASRKEALDLYRKSIEAAQIKPIRYAKIKRQTRLKWFLWGDPFVCVTEKEMDKLSRTPREKTIATLMLMGMLTYCLIAGWVGFWFMADVSIIPPDSKQAGIDLVVFKLHFGGNKPVPQAVLGPLLYILAPLMFLITNWAIRKNPNK